jgi:uncharacterized membrane protein
MAILAAPLLGVSAVYDLFAAICHQNPARSWFLAGEPLPVCIRCTSIYFGFLAALLLQLRPGLSWLKAAIIVTALEFVAARLIADSPFFRSLTGVLLGSAVAPFVAQGIVELLARRRLRESV